MFLSQDQLSQSQQQAQERCTPGVHLYMMLHCSDAISSAPLLLLQAPLLAEAGPCQAGCSCAPCVSQHLHAECCGGAQAKLTLKLRCHASAAVLLPAIAWGRAQPPAAVLLSCRGLGQGTASCRKCSALKHQKLCSCDAHITVCSCAILS